MSKIKATMMLATLLAVCTQNLPPTYTGGPPDPNSATIFTLR